MALIKTGPIPTGRQFFSGQMVRSQISFLGDALNIHVSGVVQQAHCTLLAKPGSATGIGIQLLRSNDSPMPLQQDEAVTPLVVDKTVLHFKARFFQTAPTVTAGPANGALDFTMTYR